MPWGRLRGGGGTACTACFDALRVGLPVRQRPPDVASASTRRGRDVGADVEVVTAPRVPSADERGRAAGSHAPGVRRRPVCRRRDASVATPSDYRAVSFPRTTSARCPPPKVARAGFAIRGDERGDALFDGSRVRRRRRPPRAPSHRRTRDVVPRRRDHPRQQSCVSVRLPRSPEAASRSAPSAARWRSRADRRLLTPPSLDHPFQGYTVQGKISKRPRWTEDMSASPARRQLRLRAPLRVRHGLRAFSESTAGRQLSPSSTTTSSWTPALGESGANDVTIDRLRCRSSRAMSEESTSLALRAASDPTRRRRQRNPHVVVPDGDSDRPLVADSATALDMLSEPTPARFSTTKAYAAGATTTARPRRRQDVQPRRPIGGVRQSTSYRRATSGAAATPRDSREVDAPCVTRTSTRGTPAGQAFSAYGDAASHG